MLRVLISRLQRFDPDDGLHNPDEVLGPITPLEAERYGLVSEWVIPTQLAVEVRRSENVQVRDLVDQGLLSYQVVSQLDSSITADDLDHEDLSYLSSVIDSIGSQPVGGPMLCVRCGSLSRESPISCRRCAGSLARARLLWRGAMALGVLAIAFGGYELAFTLAGSESTVPQSGDLEFLIIRPLYVTVAIGQTQKLTIAALDQFENPIEEFEVTFRVSSEAGEIDQEGRLTAGSKAGTFPEAITAVVTLGSVTLSATADVTVTISPARTVSAGGGHTCAVTEDYLLVCWGYNRDHQLGRMRASPGLRPQPFDWPWHGVPSEVAGLTGVTNVSAGEANTCAVTKPGDVWCWGEHHRGSQVGARLAPEKVRGLPSNVVSVSVGGEHACVLTVAGGVLCWGFGDRSGLMGGCQSREPCDFRAEEVEGLTSGVTAVSAGGVGLSGGGHICALTAAGDVKCWGTNEWGQLGDGTNENRTAPVDVFGLTSDVVAVTAGAHACVRLSPNPPKDTDGRREDSGRGWVRELQGRWPGLLG